MRGAAGVDHFYSPLGRRPPPGRSWDRELPPLGEDDVDPPETEGSQHFRRQMFEVKDLETPGSTHDDETETNGSAAGGGTISQYLASAAASRSRSRLSGASVSSGSSWQRPAVALDEEHFVSSRVLARTHPVEPMEPDLRTSNDFEAVNLEKFCCRIKIPCPANPLPACGDEGHLQLNMFPFVLGMASALTVGSAVALALDLWSGFSTAPRQPSQQIDYLNGSPAETLHAHQFQFAPHVHHWAHVGERKAPFSGKGPDGAVSPVNWGRPFSTLPPYVPSEDVAQTIYKRVGTLHDLPGSTSTTSTTTSSRIAKVSTALSRTSGPFAVHSPQMDLCSSETRVPDRVHAREWNLPNHSLDACYNSLGPLSSGQPRHGRNWCWVGLKEIGCHQNGLVKHLTWQQMQDKAVSIMPSLGETPRFEPLLHSKVCDRADPGPPRLWNSVETTEAHRWFEQTVAVYVVNLPSDTNRWQSIEARLKHLGIHATRVPGVDLRAPGSIEVAKREGVIPSSFDYKRAQAEAWTQKQGPLGGILGRMGCAAAHFRAQSHALRGSKKGVPKRKPLAVVFEDDVFPQEDFVHRLWDLVRKELPCDSMAVSLMSRCPYGACVTPHLSRVQPDGNEASWACRGGVNYGFQGVMYRLDKLAEVQDRWKEVVFNEDRPHCLDVDVALASISDTVGFYAVPFVQSNGFLSENHLPSSRSSIDSLSVCTVAGKDCRNSRSCCDQSMTCYEKDASWASCMTECTPGVNPHDPVETQTWWSCQKLPGRFFG